MNHNTTKREISKNIKNLIVGSYLGDGCISKNYNGAVNNFLKIEHGIKQLQYAEWKSNLFGDFAIKPYTQDRLFKGKPYQSVTFSTKAHPFCRQLRGCYINGNKQVMKWMTSYIDPMALTIWYLDDGDLMWRNMKRGDGSSYKYIGGCRISLGIFTDKSCKILSEFLVKRYNLTIKIKEERGYKRAYLNMENTRRFFEIIKELVPDCMRYKISLQHGTSQKDEDIVWTTRINKGVEEAEMTSRLQ